MSDVNAFIDAIGKDVSAAVLPKIGSLAEQVSTKTLNEYGPRVSAFAGQLVKEIFDEQSAAVSEFVGGMIRDVFARYRPELQGELHTRIVQGGLQVTGRDVRLEVKHRDTGVPVSVLEIPVSLTIKVDALGVTLQNATVNLDVIS
jgi:NADPH-dependent curcumin reductase CurA